VIFAVTKSQFDLYSRLSSFIEGSAIGLLNDSEAVVRIVQDNYNVSVTHVITVAALIQLTSSSSLTPHVTSTSMQSIKDHTLHWDSVGRFTALRQCWTVYCTETVLDGLLHWDNVGRFTALRQCWTVYCTETMLDGFQLSNSSTYFVYEHHPWPK